MAECISGNQQTLMRWVKKNAAPWGCAKVPPKEEVLEDMPVLVKEHPTRLNYAQRQDRLQAIPAASQHTFYKSSV
jgi:hypothetical protein